jgi:septation ring formation regulator EzrA
MCVVCSLNTVTDAADAVLNAVLSAENALKYGNRYGSSRIKRRISKFNSLVAVPEKCLFPFCRRFFDYRLQIVQK